MRIGCVVTDFPVLSETFIQREVAALCRAGHRVFVYAHSRRQDPLVEGLDAPGLEIVEVPFLRQPAALERAVRADGIEHLHSILMVAAHRAALHAARAIQVPVTFRTLSGHDLFTGRDADVYGAASREPLFAGFIAEDPFMADWLVRRLGADSTKIHLIANSIDLSAYRRVPRPTRNAIIILAIGRFVEKKGLIHLVQAFNGLASRRPEVTLRLVGRGPEEEALRRAASGNPRIEFLGSVTEAGTRSLYADADIFCLPCVRASDGDADGVPTTVLEAMAFELPVVTSNLLSMPSYVTDGRDGLLVEPGDVDAIAAALARLCDDPGLRDILGSAARRRVSEACHLERNVARLEQIFVSARRTLWRSKLAELEGLSGHYSSGREQYYVECRKRAITYFQPTGRLLTSAAIGKFRLICLTGAILRCDLLTDPVRGAFYCRGACQRFRIDASFDGAVLFSVLPHV